MRAEDSRMTVTAHEPTRTPLPSLPTPWPYASVTDPSWLEAGDADRYLTLCRRAVRATLPRSAATPASREDLLTAIEGARELHERLDWVLLSLVGEARGTGLSWEHIANSLGVSKQAAHKRFSPYVLEALQQADAVHHHEGS